MDNASMAKEELKIERSDLSNTDVKSLSTELLFQDLNIEVEEKLRANYETQILATKHPEFAETIKEQLSDSDKFTNKLADSIKTIEIKNLVFANNMQSHNDSIFTKKIIYTLLINSKYQQKDSALVVIKRATILIDNKPQITTSISFEHLNDSFAH